MKLRLLPYGLVVLMAVVLSSFASAPHQRVFNSKEQTACAETVQPVMLPAPFTCAQPTGLAAYLNPPGYEYTMLLWNAAGGATSYTYELYYSYFTQGSFMFLIEEGAVNSIAYPVAAYTDLPGYYDWRVKTNCSGGSSAWSYGSFYLPN